MNHVAGNQPRTTALLTAVGPNPTAFAIFLRPKALASCAAGVSMQALYPPIVDDGKPTIGGLQCAPQIVNYARMAKIEPEFPEIGARLLAVRTKLSTLSQKDWAQKHTFNPTQWNNWEKGNRRIPVESAERLCAAYGLTLDFIYRGRREGVAESVSKVL